MVGGWVVIGVEIIDLIEKDFGFEWSYLREVWKIKKKYILLLDEIVWEW